MKKALLTILTAVALLAALYIPAAQKTIGVSAQSGNIELELLMPETYEQYLELENPSDFAVNDNYIAIADKPASGNARIYIYDRSGAAGYRVYEHDTDATLSSLQLYENGGETHLYFVTSGDILIYHIDLNPTNGTYTAENTQVPGSSFLIYGNHLYYSTVTGGNVSVMQRSLNGFTVNDDATPVTGIDTQGSGITPYFAQGSDRLYFSVNNVIYSVEKSGTTATREQRWNIEHSIKSFAVSGNDLFYSSIATPNLLFVHNGTDYNNITRNGEDVERVPTMHMVADADGTNSTLYMICGNSIQTYDPTGSAFNDYEIGKYSVSDVRLGGAAEISAYGGRMVIADAANRRIGVYNSETNGYAWRSVDYAPGTAVAGKNSLLVADNAADKIYIYGYDDFSAADNQVNLAAEKDFTIDGDLIDGAYSFGSYYLLIDGAYSFGSYYLLTDGTASYGAVVAETESGYEFTATSEIGKYAQITADFLGNLYVMAHDGSVYPVSDFLAGSMGGSISALRGEVDLAADYAGNLYAVTSDAVISDKGTPPIEYPIDSALNSLVYSASTPLPQSFVFDVITGDCYLLGDGFIAKVSGMNAASLHNLSAEGVYDDLFTAALAADSAASGMLITAPAGTVAVSLDTDSLKDSGRTTLNCGDYRRLESACTGVVLSQCGYGTIVLFHTGDETTSPIRHDYEICLLLNTDDDMLASGYFLTKGEGYDYTGSAAVSNNVGVYRFPAMRIGATADEGNTGNTYETFGLITKLERGQQVTLLGYIPDQSGALDSDYYFVSYTDTQGQTAYGYIPAAYILTDGGGTNGATEQISYRQLKRGESVTLYIGGDPANSGITLSHREQLKVYDATLDEEGRIYVEYIKTMPDDTQQIYGGWIYESQLYEATPAVIAVLVVVCVVAIAVILSVCYLIFRKQPTLQ